MNIDADGDTPCEFCHKLILRKETIEFRNTCYFHLRCWEEVYKKIKMETETAFNRPQYENKTRTYPSDYNNPNASQTEPDSDYL